MSAKSRCQTCGHPRGVRANNLSKSSGKNDDKKTNLYKKPSCGCECHRAD